MKNRIKELRKYLGYTQDDFAKSLMISRNFVAQLEGGTRVPSDRTILGICDAFNVSEEWLREGIGEMFNPPEDERATYVAYLLENTDDPVAEIIMNIMDVYLDSEPLDRMVLKNFAKRLLEKKK